MTQPNHNQQAPTSGPIFIERLYALIEQIPHGRVTTYGRLARALGSVRGARMVGWALHAVPPERNLPCHRVVNRNGELSGGWHFGHPDIMKGLLLDEGVPFIGDYQVDLKRCLWLPWEDEEDSPASDEMDDLDLIPCPKEG
ncbi:MAG TPA: MGMT family protein [Thermomicrobiales bacterium]|nr:MGMT family protein [Thermomicrobiales bacterium]